MRDPRPSQWLREHYGTACTRHQELEEMTEDVETPAALRTGGVSLVNEYSGGGPRWSDLLHERGRCS